MRRTQAERRGV